MRISFNQHKNYTTTFFGIGDILCSLNALENMAIERQEIINLYFHHANEETKNKIKTIVSSFKISNLSIKYEKDTMEHIEYFAPFGMHESWIYDWPRVWGNKNIFGENAMIKFNNTIKKIPNKIGISFTVNSHKHKLSSKQSIRQIIKKLLDNKKNIYYYGYRGDKDDRWIFDEFSLLIKFEDYDLSKTIESIRQCELFYGADSGMSWISAFAKNPTKIIVGKNFGNELPKTFANMSFVDILWENFSDAKLVPISNGDLLDKLSILQIKAKFLTDEIKLLNIKNEIEKLYPLAQSVLFEIEEFLYEDLYKINLELWDIENKIRIKETQNQFDDNFIFLARSIYRLNDQRALLKKKINIQSNSEIIEEKSYV